MHSDDCRRRLLLSVCKRNLIRTIASNKVKVSSQRKGKRGIQLVGGATVVEMGCDKLDKWESNGTTNEFQKISLI